MLNYIWAGLIIFSLVFALATDIRELVEDPYRNQEEFPVSVRLPADYSPGARRVEVDVLIDPATYEQFYGTEVTPDSVYEGVLVQNQEGRQLRFGEGMRLPEPLGTIQAVNADDEGDPIRGTVRADFQADSTVVQTAVEFPTVRLRKLRDIAQAALDFAETAATLSLSLIGVLALFLGLLKIAEVAGLIHSLSHLVQPVLRPLFPDIPEDHPALAMISLNLLANVFGLGNAATPLGIKAMEELQTLNPSEDTATNSMVMLLALNTSSVQLVPPVLLVAIMGLQINQLVFSITLATLFSTIAGAAAAYFLSRTKRNRASNPMALQDEGGARSEE
ncbi:MAG: nucleoside recognition protein [Bacteroidetes bacterium]|jgi:spore maturation protein A|nr:nucleoside recognition protein [Bacteroidota bacterium]